MKSFNVLDRSLCIHQNYLLEASAGTGKTFSIQNLVVRLLIEAEEPISLEKILIVTFTRAATRDLKTRIRVCIEEALKILEKEKGTDQIPDYLQAFLEQGEAEIHRAKKNLQQALFIFDQAQIFTIHSFCAKMLRQLALEGDLGLYVPINDEQLSQVELKEIIRDFFLTEIEAESYSPTQLQIFLKQDPDQKKLLKLVKSGSHFLPFPTFQETLRCFNEIMHFLKTSFSLTAEKMIEDFQRQAPFYRNHGRETKKETLTKIIRFAKLFDQHQWCGDDLDGVLFDGVVWTRALNDQLLKKSFTGAQNLHYPTLTKELEVRLDPLIEKAGDFSHILVRMAHDCRQFLKKYQKEEEKFSPDDLLQKMDEALNYLPFLSHVRASYRAAIIDEFQDTDPIQWQIFSRLFLPKEEVWKGYLYLVGDPKQSIYSFRGADIYTYLAAAKEIGETNIFSLDTNYRSQPKLVEALNLLFNEENLPHFIPLPRENRSLLCPYVMPANHPHNLSLEDLRGAIHFFIADGQANKKFPLKELEESVFFPFIYQEIDRLKNQMGLTYQQFAVLVRDRHQATRLGNYFKLKGVPFFNQRETSLTDSAAFRSLIQLLQAILHPRDRGFIQTALGTPLMGWSYEEILNPQTAEFILASFQRLRHCLIEKGFGVFFEEVCHSTCKPNGQTILEGILSREEGHEFSRDMQQIADIIVEHQFIEWNSPEGIIPFLEKFQHFERDESEKGMRLQDPTTEGVKILTLHSSKGLEFDIVFALGLINRSDYREETIPVEIDGKMVMTASKDKSRSVQHYCEESDSEKMRQLYVAFTRAKKQLYVPIVLSPSSLEYGEASPMELFLARFNQPPAPYSMLYERIRHQTGKAFIDFIEGQFRPVVTHSIHDKIFDLSLTKRGEIAKSQLHSPKPLSIPRKSLGITSFTKQQQMTPLRSPLFEHSPNDYKSQIKEGYTLPANHQTGLMIHHIFEKLNFHDFQGLKNSEEAISLIHSFTQHNPFSGWERAISTLIFNTLKTNLSQVADDFSLASLKPTNFYREMPFIFPYKGKEIEELTLKEGLIQGIIDLFFTHKGRYYLVDWKTNWLGEDLQAYAPSSLKMAMEHNDYFLQGAIYKEAMKRYLKFVEPRPFEECFGGIFYLFIRGMIPGQSTGIFYYA